MKNGGFIMDSKIEIYEIIPQKYYPETEFIKEKTSFDVVKQILEKSTIKFPLIAKPDMGLRGSAVKKIDNLEQLENYNSKANFDYLIQKLIPFENEVGIFYIRFPHEKKGRITGIVAKELLEVVGDGTSTIQELVKQNPRFELQLDTLRRDLGTSLNDVLGKGEKRNLVPLGNHCRGAKFIDASYLISDKLTRVINKVCLQIPEFYFGRMDLMYNNWEELEDGKNFELIELNGAASEPTHIYDPKHSIFFAWKVLLQHIKYMYKISDENNKRGFPFLTHKEGMQQYKLHNKQVLKYTNF